LVGGRRIIVLWLVRRGGARTGTYYEGLGKVSAWNFAFDTKTIRKVNLPRKKEKKREEGKGFQGDILAKFHRKKKNQRALDTQKGRLVHRLTTKKVSPKPTNPASERFLLSRE